MPDSSKYHECTISIDEITVDRWLVMLDQSSAHVTANIEDADSYFWLEYLLKMKNLHKVEYMEIKGCNFLYKFDFVDVVVLMLRMPENVYCENKLLGRI